MKKISVLMFIAIIYLLFLYVNTSAEHIVLKEDSVAQGVKLPKNTKLDYNESGKILYCVLGGTIEYKSLTFPKETHIFFDINGKPDDFSYTLQKITKIQGNRFPIQTDVSFDRDGKLNNCTLGESAEIQGVKLPKDTFIFFKENGELKSYVYILQENRIISGVKLPKGTEATFNKNGVIEYCVLKDNIKNNEVIIPKEATMWFDENGKFQSYDYVLKKDTKIEGITFPKETTVTFNKYGKVADCELGGDAEIEGKKIPKGASIYFDENGKIHDYHYEFQGDTEIKGVKYAKGTMAYFDRNGKFLGDSYMTEDYGATLGYFKPLFNSVDKIEKLFKWFSWIGVSVLLIALMILVFIVVRRLNKRKKETDGGINICPDRREKTFTFSPQINDEEFIAFIGKNADKYFRIFRKFNIDGKDKFRITWNWSAFFFTWFWLIYRRIFLAATFSIGIIINIVLSHSVWFIINKFLGTLISMKIYELLLFVVVCLVLSGVLLLTFGILCGMFGNYIFYKYSKGRILKLKESPDPSVGSIEGLCKAGEIGIWRFIALVVIFNLILFVVGYIAKPFILPQETKFMDQINLDTTNSMLEIIKIELNLYFTEKGKYPTNLNVLVDYMKTIADDRGKDAIYKHILKDFWGNEYNYELLDVGKKYKLSSSGPDGKKGTKDDISVTSSSLDTVAND